jgi:Xanthosine triphosphate pyrophosphatase
MVRPAVNFITGNANKLGEVKAILEPAIEVRSQALDLPEIQGSSMEEVTIDKCRRAAELVCLHLLFTVYVNRRLIESNFQGWRPCPGGGHVPLLQRVERTAGAIHVRRCLGGLDP